MDTTELPALNYNDSVSALEALVKAQGLDLKSVQSQCGPQSHPVTREGGCVYFEYTTKDSRNIHKVYVALGSGAFLHHSGRKIAESRMTNKGIAVSIAARC